MTLSKKIINAQVMEKKPHLFSCPICSSTMELMDSSRLICANNHSFDLSKHGYINLAPQAHKTKYDKALFEARKTIIDSGFFSPLLNYITEITTAQLAGQKDTVIVDAGCGEGSHLAKLLSGLMPDVTGVGIDLAKEGIAVAAREYPGTIWAVADLAKCPFQDAQFDVVLNILSPANYAEFTRLLKPSGLFLKVVPESAYLQELRDVFYDDKEQRQETDPVARMADFFDSVETKRITYDFPLEGDLLTSLIQMTPLTWGASEEKIEEALRLNISSITIDFNVIMGRKK